MPNLFTTIAFAGAAIFFALVIAGWVSGTGVEPWQLGTGVLLAVVGLNRLGRDRGADAGD